MRLSHLDPVVACYRAYLETLTSALPPQEMAEGGRTIRSAKS